LEFLLLFLLRAKNQEIEDQKNQDDRRKAQKSTEGVLTRLEEKKMFHVFLLG